MLQPLINRYRNALREEPKLRAYISAALIDDVGVAVTAWAAALLMTDLFVDQRARARVLLPTLVCFLVGSVLSGPLADWASSRGISRIAHWRYRVVVWGRVIETLALAILVWSVVHGSPSIARVLPYMMVSAFMKTALRATRGAFEVDLLRCEQPQHDARGDPLRDERGEVRMYKTHLLSFGAMSSALRSLATLVGLFVGGKILHGVHGAYWPLFAFDLLTNAGFIAVVAYGCHPSLRASQIGLGTWLKDLAPSGDEVTTLSREQPIGVLRQFFASLRDGAKFLAQRDQRPLLALLAGTWLVEIVNEMYETKMIIRHVLHGSDGALRHAEIGWQIIGVVGAVLLPLLARRVENLGKIFLLTMFIDGFVIAMGGKIAGFGAASAIIPFAVVMGMDKTLTLTSGTLADLAQNSASSSAMRGRIAAFYAFTVLIGDLLAEIVATGISESIGIPAMLVRVGLCQIALVGFIAFGGGRALWTFGLRATDAKPEARDLELAA